MISIVVTTSSGMVGDELYLCAMTPSGDVSGCGMLRYEMTPSSGMHGFETI